MLYDPFQGCRTKANFIPGLVYIFQVSIFKTKILVIEGRGIFPSGSHRVGPGEKVPTHAVSIDQAKDLELGRVFIRSNRLRYKIFPGKLKSLEKMAPVFSNRLRIVQEILVKLVNGFRI